MSSIERIISHYRLVFRLPTSLHLVIGTLLASVLFPYTLYAFWRWQLQTAVAMIVLTFASAMLSAIVSYFSLRETAVFSFRRSVGLSLTSVFLGYLTTLTGALLGALTRDQSFIQAGLIAALPTAFFLRIILIHTMTQATVWKKSAVSLTQSLFWSPALLLLSVPMKLPALITLHVAALTTSSIFLMLLRKGYTDIPTANGLTLARAFLSAWLGSNTGGLEAILSSEGVSAEVRIGAALFREQGTGRPVMSLLVPTIHPGPLRNIGSSQLPSKLAKEIASTIGVPVLVPHAAVTHNHDLTSSEELERVILAVKEEAWSTQMGHDKWSFWGAYRAGSSSCCMKIGDTVLVGISMAPFQCEDVPQDLVEQLSQRCLSLGAQSAWLVDAHNCYDGPQPPSSLRTLLLQQTGTALTYVMKGEGENIQASIFPISSEGIEEQELCGMGGNIIVGKFGDITVGLVLFDSNNVVLSLKEHIVETLRKKGLHYTEVFTSDTHEKTGFALGTGYAPLGMNTDHGKVVENVSAALDHAMLHMGPCTVQLQEIRPSPTVVIGNQGFTKLAEVAEKLVPYAKYVLPLMALLTQASLVILAQLLIHLTG